MLHASLCPGPSKEGGTENNGNGGDIRTWKNGGRKAGEERGGLQFRGEEAPAKPAKPHNKMRPFDAPRGVAVERALNL